MYDAINESEMDFISDNAFWIEKSTLYSNLSKGIKSVEFIRIKDDSLLFVEARKSFPDPNNPNPDNITKFHSQIDDICEKFKHSLNLFSSVKVGIAEITLPDDFILPVKTSLVFILVLKNHDLKGCRRIKTQVYTSLPQYLKTIWKPMVFVINQQTAINRNLAIS
jgi:hypothetical protein